MIRASVRFYAELNDFLPAGRRLRALEYESYVPPSVKDMIEGLGVPHTEVDLVLVNGHSVDFTYRVGDGDRVSVYPVFEAIDIGPVAKLRPRPLREPRFVLDAHLGKLASYLRLLGFDAVWSAGFDDADLARISSEDQRILLSRDRGLLKRSLVTHGCYVRQTEPRSQLIELLRRLDLASLAKPFTRCLKCNSELKEAAKETVADRLPPRTRELYDRFWSCAGCGRLYWAGSHHGRMRQFVASVLDRLR